MFDITPIINAILALIAAVITYYIIPWLKAKKTEVYAELSERDRMFFEALANTCVTAAQQLYTDNFDRLDYAMSQFKSMLLAAGYAYDDTEARAYIESAVFNKKFYGHFPEDGAITPEIPEE